MTENKRYKVAVYDEKAIGGYCVLDLEKPSQTARLKYKNVYISSKAGCNIVCDLLNEQEEEIRRLNHLVKIATYLIEWNTVPQVRREWQKHLSKVGDVE